MRLPRFPYVSLLVLLSFFFLMSPSIHAEENSIFKTASDQTDAFEGVDGSSITEVKYGNRIYLKIAGTGIIEQDEKLNRYMRDLRERLIRDVKRKTLPYLIVITRESRIYAASTPGGYLYVSLGMIAYLNTESELAAALAHEIASSQYKSQEFRLSKRLFKLVSSTGGMAVSLLLPGSAIGVKHGMRFVDRFVLKDPSLGKMLLTADKEGFSYLKSAGFRPYGFYDLFRTFLDAEGGMYPLIKMYLQIRPVTSERQIQLQKLLEGIQDDAVFRQHELNSYVNVKRYAKELLSRV